MVGGYRHVDRHFFMLLQKAKLSLPFCMWREGKPRGVGGQRESQET
jgi:hypothetical protein